MTGVQTCALPIYSKGCHLSGQATGCRSTQHFRRSEEIDLYRAHIGDRCIIEPSQILAALLGDWISDCYHFYCQTAVSIAGCSELAGYIGQQQAYCDLLTHVVVPLLLDIKHFPLYVVRNQSIAHASSKVCSLTAPTFP